MILSKNFTLEEFMASQTATRYGIKEQMDPPQNVIHNLGRLCRKILQPLRDNLGPLRISSGYRCIALNRLIHSNDNSQHVLGMAADIQFFENGVMDNQKIIDTVIRLGLDYDQMIDEFGLSWVHLSYNISGNRKQFLTII
jgi:zinc D-Ala-D-Ala carboxypeptidase